MDLFVIFFKDARTINIQFQKPIPNYQNLNQFQNLPLPSTVALTSRRAAGQRFFPSLPQARRPRFTFLLRNGHVWKCRGASSNQGRLSIRHFEKTNFCHCQFSIQKTIIVLCWLDELWQTRSLATALHLCEELQGRIANLLGILASGEQNLFGYRKFWSLFGYRKFWLQEIFTDKKNSIHHQANLRERLV